MEYVHALRNVNDIHSMKTYLKQQSERDYLLFVFGINTGLKINEILGLKVADVYAEGRAKDFCQMPFSEGKKAKEVFLNQNVKEAIAHYVQAAHMSGGDYLFQSKKTGMPITRQQAYRIIHQAAEAVGIQENVGTDSMRKTFGFHAYKRGVAVSLLQKHFNHASPSETLKYLGISKEEQIRTQIDVNL